MAEYTKTDLRRARDAQGMPRWQLANALGVSDDTIKRWEDERDKSMPTPEDVDKIGEVLGDPTIWHRWMLTWHDSYRKRYSYMENLALPVSAMRNRHELQDVLRIQDEFERAVMSGGTPNTDIVKQYIKEASEAVAALTDTLQQLPGGVDP